MAVNSVSQKEFAQAFIPHNMPPNALAVRCHVLDDTKAKVVEDFLVEELPWCYATTANVKRRAKKTGRTPSQIIANRLPNPGSVMSGDFGEITTMFFLASERDEPMELIKKWRYKQDRTKPIPLSDIIILYREAEDRASKNDFVLCAEAKQKSTSSSFSPIAKAVEGFKEDSTGRLGRTLAWLREKAIDQENEKRITLIERFALNVTIEYAKYFKAVAIVDRALLNAELTRQVALPTQNDSFEVVVLGIRNLKTLYEKVFQRAQEEIGIE